MSERYAPFHALGFHCNPFRVLSEVEWAEIAVLPEGLAAIQAGEFAHVQFLGPIGSGKTTTLLGLAARFKQAGRRTAYEYIPAGQRDFHTQLYDIDILLLDEVQRLSRSERARLLLATIKRQGKLQLVLSSHEDLAAIFAQRTLPLNTIRLTSLTSAHLRAILERRLAYFALSREPHVAFSDDAINYLHTRFGDNLRATEQFLYELFQQQRPGGRLTSAQLQMVQG